MDAVYIRQLKVDAIIGIHDWERRVRQTLVLDLEMGLRSGDADAAPGGAGESDSAGAADATVPAVDYETVSEHVTGFVQAGEFRLLETLAQRLADELLSAYNLPWLKLRVGKPGALPDADAVGVLIERKSPPATPR